MSGPVIVPEHGSADGGGICPQRPAVIATLVTRVGVDDRCEDTSKLVFRCAAIGAHQRLADQGSRISELRCLAGEVLNVVPGLFEILTLGGLERHSEVHLSTAEFVSGDSEKHLFDQVLGFVQLALG